MPDRKRDGVIVMVIAIVMATEMGDGLSLHEYGDCDDGFRSLIYLGKVLHRDFATQVIVEMHDHWMRYQR